MNLNEHDLRPVELNKGNLREKEQRDQPLAEVQVPPDQFNKVPFWKRGQFKRYLGAVLTALGGAIALYPPTLTLGTGLGMLGGIIFAGGFVDAAMKKRKGDYPGETITGLIIQIVKALYQIYTLWKEQRNARK